MKIKNQVEVKGAMSTVSTEQGAGAARTRPRMRLANPGVILKHLGLGPTLHRTVSTCNNESSSAPARKNNFSETNTEQEAGDLTSEQPVSCLEQSNLRSGSSPLSLSPSTSQTPQLSENSLQKDDELLHGASCTVVLEELSLPYSFGKQHSSQSRRPKREDYSPRHVAGSSNKKSKSHWKSKSVERFDICLSETEAALANSSENEDGLFLRSPQDDVNGIDELEGNMTNEEPSQTVLRPGKVLLKKYISPSEQVSIVQKCQKLGLGRGGFYRPGYKDGAKLRLYMMCLGLDWDPQTRKYQKRRQIDRAKPPNIPHEFHLLVNRAMQDSLSCIRENCNISNAEKILPKMSADVCIVNFYTETGRLGLHQDCDESRESLSKGLPVVSFSIGDSAEFLYGDQRDINQAEKLVLESGDVLVFGGDSRHVFHGISSIIPGSAPDFLEETQLRPGRLNLTFRQY